LHGHDSDGNPVSRPVTYHHGDLRRALLDALPDVIRKQGLDRVSLRELARRAGVSHGAPAHHFGDRRGLLTAFATEGSRHLEARVVQALAGAAPGDHAERLTAVGMGYLEFALRHPEHFGVVFRPERLDLADPDLVAARAAAGRTLDQVLEAAIDAGWLERTRFPAVRMASWALAHGYAALAIEVFSGLPADAHRAQARAAFDEFTRRVLAAPQPRRPATRRR
jgi:AcrR family transcriptional regulator